MTTLLRGLYTALATPFDQQGEVDLVGLKQNISEQISAHVSGVVLIGSTGENSTLTAEEEEAMIATAAELINGKCQLIVGIGSPSTKTSIKKLKKAQDGGADAVIVISPYGNKPTQEGLYHHFQAISSESNIPVILYNHPGRTGVSISLETIRRLLGHTNIVGIKDCSCDMGYFMELCRLFKNEMNILSGDDLYAYSHVGLGASALISTASNLFPHVMVKLVSLVLERRFDEALSLHYKMLPLFQALNTETNPIPLKKGMELMGKPSGLPRLPLTPLSAAHTATLEKLLCNVRPTSHV